MISIVIPAFDEAESLAELHRELSAVAADHHYDLEIIFVDDGSRDATWSVIRQLAAGDPRVHGIRMRRNFGKAAALSAGFRAARGDLVMTLDADLQDDPAGIPRFLAKLDEGYDVISGWKQVRHDPWHKVYPSRVFNWLASRSTGVTLHDHNCGMKCYRREALAELRLYGEMHRFVPVLAAARGFRVGEISIEHRPRIHGKSKYGVWRFLKGLLDLMTVLFLTGFDQRPQHLLGSAGLVSFVFGTLGMGYLAMMWVLTRLFQAEHPLEIHNTALVYYCLAAILLGVQLISIGFLAELITYIVGRNVENYSILEQTAAPAPHKLIPAGELASETPGQHGDAALPGHH
ncbi:MAG: glycosyltransferase family 2 protein [Planctomycetia bacterium]|nr:glycosyltransferase family 2 protein [Planctomycetia bacterium]